MELDIYQVDAFASKPFEGNPAAVIPLPEWLPDGTLQSIAMENNLSETVYFVKHGDRYHIRWFTPVTEVNLCGHATLASAFVIFEHIEPDRNCVEFESKSGRLSVERTGKKLSLDFPATPLESCKLPSIFTQAIGKKPTELLMGKNRYLAVYNNQKDISNLSPDFRLLEEIGDYVFIATAPGDEVDFVSRFFAPYYGIDEDPVTGSAHCELTPYWAERLNKNKLSAYQLSKRGGALEVEIDDERVKISGTAVSYLQGKITV